MALSVRDRRLDKNSVVGEFCSFIIIIISGSASDTSFALFAGRSSSRGNISFTHTASLL